MTRELEVGTTSRDNGDGTWSTKLQIDNIPSDVLADAIEAWLYDLVASDMDRALTARKRRLQ